MLALGRKVGEEFTVILPDGRKGRIALIDIFARDRAKIGFDLPPDVVIVRSELLSDPAMSDDFEIRIQASEIADAIFKTGVGNPAVMQQIILSYLKGK